MNKRGLLNILMVSVFTLLVVLSVADTGLAVTPQVAAGADFTITLRSDGTIWATGINDLGQLGDGTLIQRNLPVQTGLPGNGTGWTAVAVGVDHAVALKADGTLWTWGGNGAGQLGIGTINALPTSAPVQVGSDHDWIAVAAGASCTVALKGDGTLWAWGDNSAGQLGTGVSGGLPASSPVAVLNQNLDTNLNIKSYYVAVSISNRHVLALQADGSLWAWGDNQFGQLGAAPAVFASNATPQQIQANPVSGVDNFWTAVSAGGGHSLARQADGSLWSWGANSFGQLGTSSAAAFNPVPARVGSAVDWAGFSAGDLHTIAFKQNGSLWAWGANISGQLGIGGTFDFFSHNVPLAVTNPAGINNLISVAAGTAHSLALKANGSLYAWGDNDFGEMGTGTFVSSSTPVLVGQEAPAWVSVELGGQHALARRADGSLWTWGDNSSGQSSLDPAVTNRLANPVRVVTADNWSVLSGGFIHSAAIQADGTLWTWGSNGFGQLGDNSTIDRYLPQQVTLTAPVSAANDWFAVSAGDAHTLAIKTDGSLWAWGDNFAGQLGDGSTAPQILPIRIVTGNPGNFDNNWIAVAAGSLYSLGLQADGTLWIWGDNGFGQFAIDPQLQASSLTPQQIINFVAVPGNPEFNSNWTAIAAGQNHWLGLQGNGTVWGGGANSAGQLGNGTPTAIQFDVVQVQNNGLPVVPYVAVAAGDSHSALLKADGSVWLMGNNTSGQLGIGATDPDIFNPVAHAVPVRENSAANDWIAISAGGRHTAALKANGSTALWGENDFGQMGDGTTTLRNAPVVLGSSLDANPVMRRLSDTLSGSVLQPLYDTTFAAAETIQLRSVTITENPVFARPGVTVDLRGGYDTGFANAAGTSVVNGVLIVKDGKVTAQKIILKSPHPMITTANPLTDGQATIPYAGTLAASGGTGPYTFAITGGALPAGVILAANGQLSGTPATSGTYDFTVTVTDSAALTNTKAFSVTILPEPLVFTTATNLGTYSIASGPVNIQFAASGGTPPYTFDSAGFVALGFTFTPDGLLAGTPPIDSVGVWSVPVTVTDSALPAFVTTTSFTLTVNP